jgi:tape measure domain-containing protein
VADRNVKVNVRADVSDFKRGMGDAAKSAEDLGTKTQAASAKAKTGLSGMAQSVRDNREAFSTVGGALTAYGAAVTGLGVIVAKTGIDYNTLRQRSVAALTTLTGSAADANAQMDKLDAFATTSPFARGVFIEAQQQMLGFGIETQKVIPYLDAIQQSVAATGGSNHDISELSRIFSQISASAKITATDLREFGNRGIDAATIIGSQMGKTGAQIREEITAGTLDAQVALDALAAGMQDRFGGAADNVKNTMVGAIDRVKAAFRDLSASAMTPFVDPEGGGLAVDGLNKLADALRRFESMPDGLRNTTLALGGLSGVASLAAGGFLLLAPRIVDTWDALKQLGIVTPTTAGTLGALGKVAGGAAIGFAAIAGIGTVLDKIRVSTEAATPGIEGFTSALLDAAQSGSVESLDRQFADLGIQVNGLSGMAEGPLTSFRGAVDRMLNPSFIQRAEDLTDGLLGVRTSSDQTAEELGRLDTAVAGLVASGNPEVAAEAFDVMWMSLTGGAYSKEEFLTLFPQYAEAMQGVENQARLATEATDGFAESLIRLPDGVPTKLEQMREGAANLSGSIRDAAGAFVDFSTDIDDTEVSLDKWLNTLLEQAAARDKWVENMRTLAEAGLEGGFYQALIDQGPDGALRVQQMVDEMASGRDVSEFNAMGRKMGQGAANGVADEIAETKFPTVDLEAAIDRADFKAQALDLVTRTPEQVGAMQMQAELDLEDEKARVKAAETILWASEQTGTMNLDADSLDAHIKIDQWNALAANTVGMPTLDADPVKAAAQLRAWQREANRTVATSSLDADTGRASGAAASWQSWASALRATASVGASTSPATSSVFGLMGWIGQQWATINVTARYAGGLNVGGAAKTMASARAAGGVERRPMMMGPGYGPTNVILAGEPETRGEAFISNHPAYKSQNIEYLRTAAGWFGMDVVKAYAAGGVAQRWSAPQQASASSGPVTAYLAPEHVALLEAVASRPAMLAPQGIDRHMAQQKSRAERGLVR